MEVLLLSDEIDEWMVNHLQEYKGKQLRSVTKGELDAAVAGDEQDSESEEARDHDGLLKAFEAALGERVKAVRITNRLTVSPACLVADANEMGGHLERLLKAAGQDVPSSLPILEINPDHVLLTRFAREADEQRREDWANILFDQALLSEGGRLSDPAGFVRRLNEMFLAVAGGGSAEKGSSAGPEKTTRKTAKKTAKKTAEGSKKDAAAAPKAKRGPARKKADSGTDAGT
jgi:molecular chaperone HtpG